MTRARDVASNGGMVLINSTTFTAQSTISFNNVFSSTYDNYKLVISATGTTSANVNMRLRVGGVDNASAIYKRQFLRAIDTSVSGDYSFLTETNIVDIDTTTTGVCFTEIFSPALAAKTRILSNFNAGRNDYVGLFYTNHDTATAYDGFSLLPSAGTATGTISIYGYKK